MNITECRYCGARKDDLGIDPLFCKSSRRKDKQHTWDEIEADPAEDPDSLDIEDDSEAVSWQVCEDCDGAGHYLDHAECDTCCGEGGHYA